MVGVCCVGVALLMMGILVILFVFVILLDALVEVLSVVLDTLMLAVLLVLDVLMVLAIFTVGTGCFADVGCI